MARKKTNKNNYSRRTRVSKITLSPMRSPKPYQKYYQTDIMDFIPQTLTEIQDTRRFHPTEHPTVELSGRPAARPRPTPSKFDIISAFLQHQAPAKVLRCVRKKIRKEVIFALGKNGRGGQKKPVRNENSNIWC